MIIVMPTYLLMDHHVASDRTNLFDQPVKMIYEHMITFEILQPFKGMITQLIVY